MNVVRAAIATSLVAVGCSGQTLDVGYDAGAAPEYAGPGPMVPGPAPVATHQYGALAVAVDDTRVYWSTDLTNQTRQDLSVVRSCTKADCGGSVVTYGNQQWDARRLVARRGRIYWRVTSGDQSSQSIVACPVDGCPGAPALIASGVSAWDFVVDDEAVYFSSPSDAAILRCPIGGCQGAPTVVALLDAPVFGLAADQKNLYWSEAAAADSGAIKTIRKDGSTPAAIVAAGLHLPGAVAVYADRVYWAESVSQGTIRSCPIAGCAGEPTALVTEQRYPQGLAVDQAHVYWFTIAEPSGGKGQILECPLGGCGSSPTVLATDQPTPTGLAVDSSSVFWTNKGEAKYDSRPSLYYDGSVNRVPIAWP